jgi:hypothetical protein
MASKKQNKEVKPEKSRAENYQEKFVQVCEIIASGKPLNKAVQGIMSRQTFHSMVDKDASNLDLYTRAREERADKLFEEILVIADKSDDDIELLEFDGVAVEKTNREVIERSKIRIDARKWMIAKMQPKKYGDRINQDVTIQGEQPLFPDELPKKD